MVGMNCPLLDASSTEYGMFKDFKNYHWVLPVKTYESLDDAIESVEAVVTHSSSSSVEE